MNNNVIQENYVLLTGLFLFPDMNISTASGRFHTLNKMDDF